jgi:integrase
MVKRAAILSDKQIKTVLAAVKRHRYPERDRAMLLLSIAAGLRPKEIALVTWRMVIDSEGEICEALHLENSTTKGNRQGRVIPLNKELCSALVALKATRNSKPGDRIIHGERKAAMTPVAVRVWFHRLYTSWGFVGASGHSGRRTFITRSAWKVVTAGGSLFDVQQLAGHSSLNTTRRYIKVNQDAKRRLVDL